MRPRLKPLAEQVIVITGATSGIGLSTARAAAAAGARLMLAARNEAALKVVCQDLRSRGGQVDFTVTDVGVEGDVRRLAKAAIERFGGFDTWINNAGVAIFGDIDTVPVKDQRRLFETNYWGVVYGSLVAVEHLRERPGGGALINMGSQLGHTAIPTQGPYAASKHAVHGFTDALRLELRASGAPVSVTLIKPSAIDTPYSEHARNYVGHPATNPPPVYAAPLVAQAILHAAQRPVRDLTVGGTGAALLLAGRLFPALGDPLMAKLVPWLSRDRHPPQHRGPDNLHKAGEDLKERSWRPGVHDQSLTVAAQMRPVAAVVILTAGALAIVAAFVVGKRLTVAPRRSGEDGAATPYANILSHFPILRRSSSTNAAR